VPRLYFQLEVHPRRHPATPQRSPNQKLPQLHRQKVACIQAAEQKAEGQGRGPCAAASETGTAISPHPLPPAVAAAEAEAVSRAGEWRAAHTEASTAAVVQGLAPER